MFFLQKVRCFGVVKRRPSLGTFQNQVIYILSLPACQGKIKISAGVICARWCSGKKSLRFQFALYSDLCRWYDAHVSRGLSHFGEGESIRSAFESAEASLSLTG